MKPTTTAKVSVDGVMQGLGGPDEDRRGGELKAKPGGEPQVHGSGNTADLRPAT